MATTTTVDSGTDDHAGGPARLSYAARVLLASLSLGAGVIHLVMAPIHATGSVPEAIAFAVVGWLQVLLAVGLVARPSKLLVEATVVLNLVAIGAWVMSRTVGLPFGEQPWVAEKVGNVDLITVIFEGVLVVAAAVVLVRPRIGSKLSEPMLVLASIVPVAVLVAASMVLADPSTAAHNHTTTTPSSTAQLAAIASQRCDLGLNPASYWRDATTASIDTITGTHSHGTTSTSATTSADGHTHATTTPAPSSTTTTLPSFNEGRGSAELDRAMGASSGTGEMDAAKAVIELSKVSDDTYQEWLRRLDTITPAPSTTATGSGTVAPDDNGGHGGHIGPQGWTAMTNQADCDKLASELAEARKVALSYPTAADAKAAGYVQVTPYVPGIAAHYMKFQYVDDKFVLDQPEMILYDGNGDNAAVVGLSYYITHDGTGEPTQGFTGDDDHYHRHVGLCVRGTMVIGDTTTTKEQCEAQGGTKAEGTAGWMSHAWVVPGCESPWGVFSGANPILDGHLGKVSGSDGGGCAGSSIRSRYDLSPGSDTNTPTTVRGGDQVAAGN